MTILTGIVPGRMVLKTGSGPFRTVYHLCCHHRFLSFATPPLGQSSCQKIEMLIYIILTVFYGYVCGPGRMCGNVTN
jgi:hypothetical protein